MFHQGIQGIPYYLGIRSLADIATPEDRVCVLNIMGGESRQVTPTSHAFSGGNVVFGTSPGRAGPGAEDAGRRHPGLQQRPRGAGRRAYLQHRRRLPAAVGRARRRGGADPGQLRTQEDRHHHREDRGARRPRDPGDGAGERRRHHRRQLPRRGGLVEPGADRRGAGRRPSGRVADQGVGGDLLELGRLHHDDRAVSRDGGLGDDDARFVGQGPLHPLCLPRLCACLRGGRPVGGGGALCRAGRLL